MIVGYLILAKACTYGDSLKSAEGIATNILASRLQALEENKIVKKLDHPDNKAKVSFSASLLGTLS